jgi:hypothetical protein
MTDALRLVINQTASYNIDAVHAQYRYAEILSSIDHIAYELHPGLLGGNLIHSRNCIGTIEISYDASQQINLVLHNYGPMTVR